MILAKVIVLQILWFVPVCFGHQIHDAWIFAGALAIVLLNYKLYQPPVSFKFYLACLVGFSLYGFVQDFTMFKLGIIIFHEGYYPFWLNSLFWIFIAYYGDVFNYLSNKPLALLYLLGGGGGVMAYWSGVRLGAMNVNPEAHILFSTILFFSWGLFFSGSIKIFYKNAQLSG